MSGTHPFKIGDRGRVVLPIELRQKLKWDDGTILFAVEEENGVLLLTREQLRARIVDDMSGPSLADELIADRHAEAARDRQ